jgi:hypothetical protein
MGQSLLNLDNSETRDCTKQHTPLFDLALVELQIARFSHSNEPQLGSARRASQVAEPERKAGIDWRLLNVR